MFVVGMERRDLVKYKMEGSFIMIIMVIIIVISFKVDNLHS